jgi:hypothetical protein
MSDPERTAHDKPDADKKVTLTVSTIDAGDYTHDYPIHQKLEVVVQQTIEHLKIVGDGPWILELDGNELPLTETIEQSDLKDGDVLTLSGQEGGGGSNRL